MQFLKRGLMAAGALALAVMLLNLAAPKRVHAAVVTLVQVMNTIANPAITQDTSKTAGQLVNVLCTVNWASNDNAWALFSSALNGTYTVPSGQNLVITSIVITPSFDSGGATGTEEVVVANSCNEGAFGGQVLNVTGTATTQFVYPSSATVVPAGCHVAAELTSASGGLATTPYNTFVWVSGYLTAN